MAKELTALGDRIRDDNGTAVACITRLDDGHSVRIECLVTGDSKVTPTLGEGIEWVRALLPEQWWEK